MYHLTTPSATKLAHLLYQLSLRRSVANEDFCRLFIQLTASNQSAVVITNTVLGRLGVPSSKNPFNSKVVDKCVRLNVRF